VHAAVGVDGCEVGDQAGAEQLARELSA
jgi:hypothetical protein